VSIVSSVIASSDVQADGRFQVHEQHTDTLGLIVDVFYTADADYDQQARLVLDAAHITEQQNLVT